MWQVIGRTGWQFGSFTGEIKVSKEQEGHRENESIEEWEEGAQHMNLAKLSFISSLFMEQFLSLS